MKHSIHNSGLKPVYFIFIALLCINFYIYSGASHGPYIIDDYPNLVYNNNLFIEELNWESIKQAATSSPINPYHRPLSMLSFAANYSIAGNNEPYSIKITNIAIHILIGVGIFVLTILLLERSTDPVFKKLNPKIISLLVSGIWLFHPLFVSTVLYAVQRMAMLSTFFTIFGCIFYITIRQKTLKENRGLIPACIGIMVITIIAFFSKENGALIPGFALLIEYFFFQFKFHPQTREIEKRLLSLTLFTPVIFIILYVTITYAIYYADTAPHYPYTYTERLLTQSRIMWNYVGWLSLTNPEPILLYHDDMVVSRNFYTPLSTIFSIISWAIVISGTIILALKRNLFAFCITWFLWGHILESTIFPLAMLFEHRNYLPAYGLLLGLVLIFIKFINNRSTFGKYLIGLFSVIFLCILTSSFYNRVNNWKSPQSMALYHLSVNPNSTNVMLNAANLIAMSGDFENALQAHFLAEDNQKIPKSLILGELSLRCLLRPDEKLEKETLRKMADVNFDNPQKSENAQFLILVRNCEKSRINHDELMGLYRTAAASPDGYLTMLAYYGISTLLEYRDIDLAIQSTKKAISAHHGGELMYGDYLRELQQLKQTSNLGKSTAK